ncbi:hypothetical protein [Formosa algae]|uniref:Uncharacterized protein n=1 Tax=Formosa algae TaxID=225843 RepID=A0A9X1CC67_9FLAO|nr:hypothetical protein [Formosa algae]MBP1839839.1 hypothetical protein [Formosa algae]MDQ0335438.1 hypothetical protein [Formosa algae]OEI79015.1 hypothetical protein AST99_16560 [Formosa algae]PNW28058.1 hypothetical protein BKP44_10420 [Formosa algae]
MNKLEQYSDEEWNKIAVLPQLVGAIIAAAESSGLVGSTKEMMATAKSFLGAKEKYPNNALIQAIIPQTKDVDVVMEDVSEEKTRFENKIKEYEVKTKDELTAKVLEDCKSAMVILKDKESEATISEYTTWLLEIAQNVANAGTEGDFLGFGGVKYSDNEKTIVEALKEALS